MRRTRDDDYRDTDSWRFFFLWLGAIAIVGGILYYDGENNKYLVPDYLTGECERAGGYIEWGELTSLTPVCIPDPFPYEIDDKI